MNVNLFLFQMALVFFPGLIWARLDASFAAKNRIGAWEFFLKTFMFGVTTYAVVFVAFAALGWSFVVADFGDATARSVVTKAIAWEIVWACLTSVLLALLWIYASNYKLIALGLKKIGATRKYGGEDVWDFTLNQNVEAVRYIHFRDFENSYVYAGNVSAFSESEKRRELVLTDVIVYDFEGNPLFHTPMIYLARPPENIHIEFLVVQRIEAASDEKT